MKHHTKLWADLKKKYCCKYYTYMLQIICVQKWWNKKINSLNEFAVVKLRTMTTTWEEMKGVSVIRISFILKVAINFVKKSDKFYFVLPFRKHQ